MSMELYSINNEGKYIKAELKQSKTSHLPGCGDANSQEEEMQEKELYLETLRQERERRKSLREGTHNSQFKR